MEDDRRIDVIGLAGQGLRFAAVGASNTLLSWCAYALLTAAGTPYQPASALAFGLGALNSYALNRRWTFRSRAARGPELTRFAAVQCVGLGLDLTLLDVLLDAGMHHLVAQALVFPAASAVMFGLSRQWAFAGVSSAT